MLIYANCAVVELRYLIFRDIGGRVREINQTAPTETDLS